MEANETLARKRLKGGRAITLAATAAVLGALLPGATFAQVGAITPWTQKVTFSLSVW